MIFGSLAWKLKWTHIWAMARNKLYNEKSFRPPLLKQNIYQQKNARNLLFAFKSAYFWCIICALLRNMRKLRTFIWFWANLMYLTYFLLNQIRLIAVATLCNPILGMAPYIPHNLPQSRSQPRKKPSERWSVAANFTLKNNALPPLPFEPAVWGTFVWTAFL